MISVGWLVIMAIVFLVILGGVIFHYDTKLIILQAENDLDLIDLDDFEKDRAYRLLFGKTLPPIKPIAGQYSNHPRYEEMKSNRWDAMVIEDDLKRMIKPLKADPPLEKIRRKDYEKSK